MTCFERVQLIHDFPSLLEYLRDELGWSADADDFEDLVFDFTPGELGLDARGALKIGAIRQLRPMFDSQPWGVFLLEFNGPEISVTALRQLLRALVPKKRAMKGSQTWLHTNLLFICAARDYKEFAFAHFKGEKAQRAALTTFGWRQGDHHLRTLCEHNLPKLRWVDDPSDADAWLTKWRAAFDVEAATKRFYKEYERVFTLTKTEIKGISGDALHLFTQKLFNRLMFLVFLERKGWLEFGGRTDYLRALWADHLHEKASDSSLNFYRSRLMPLFFQALNNPAGRNLIAINGGGVLGKIVGNVPFLNGGLFEQGDDDRNEKITIPDAVFARTIEELFYRFNFTVAESTPLDVEVAVDPEMLGKIFEELVTGRHESGSYYTPKPIVSFMCLEALEGYLRTALGREKPEAIERFVQEHDASGLRNPEGALDALRRVKVCDPACGSGAYLLGMLHELLALRQVLFAAGAPDARTIYRRKLEIIGTNIYGVDIDPFATSIAMLRLWLSLVVDDTRNPLREDVDVALPNLGYKIETGDSLAAPDPHSADMELQGENIQRFRALKGEYLKEHHPEKKKKLKEEIERLRAEIKNWMHGSSKVDGFDWGVEFAEVFLPEREAGTTMHGEFGFVNQVSHQQNLIENEEQRPGGFDIIVANPPYVRHELIKEQKPTLKRVFPEVYTGTADLYVFFYARALQILREGGMLAFISSNKWFRAGYGAKLRELMATSSSVDIIADFGDTPVFEAIAYPTIVMTTKGKPARGNARVLTWRAGPPIEEFRDIFEREAMALDRASLNGEGWKLESPAVLRLIEKIRGAGTPLDEYVEGRFYYGIKTGLNEAFVVDRTTRDRLIAEHRSSADVLKPFLRGRDVKRWVVESDDLWLIFTRHGIKIDKYPAIKGYLSSYRSQLEPKPADWPHNKKWDGRKSGSYKWYEIQDNIAYWEEFEQPKIVLPAIANDVSFAADYEGHFGNDKTSICVTEDLEYILAILNSRLSSWYLGSISATRQGGFLEFKPMYVTEVPIPSTTAQQRATITKLVERILEAKGRDANTDVSDLEAQINRLVYEAYELTDEEVGVIEVSLGERGRALSSDPSPEGEHGDEVLGATQAATHPPRRTPTTHTPPKLPRTKPTKKTRTTPATSAEDALPFE